MPLQCVCPNLLFRRLAYHTTRRLHTLSVVWAVGKNCPKYSPQRESRYAGRRRGKPFSWRIAENELLIDCNLQFGDVDAFLNLQAQSNISDLTKAVHDIDQSTIDAVLVTHGSGLKVLVAPPHPEQAYDVAPDAVSDLVQLLANSYDFVVVDTPPLYDDMTLKLFDIAERIVLIANPTLPSVRNTRKILDIFDGLQNPPGLGAKVMFVLNRAVNEKEKGRGTIPSDSIEKHLKRRDHSPYPVG